MSAPDVTMPSTPDQSTLASAMGPNNPQMPSEQSTGSPQEQAMNDAESGPNTEPAGGSRLTAILSAVAKVGSTALQGVPAGNRPSFAGGLGQGARAEQAAQNLQNEIKFKDFDSQVRVANLHAQDLELQNRTQAQQDAHQKMQDDQQDWDEAHGIDHNPIPNTGNAVIDHLTAQTAANGAATVPSGTHLSADGNSINVPTDTQETRAGQLAKYNTFAPLYGLPPLPQGAQFVPPRNMDLLTHVQQGYGIDGHPIKHDDLPGYIAALQTQRDTFAKNGSATPVQLQALDNTIAIQKANLKALDDHAASVTQQNAQSKKAGEVAAENSPEAIKGAADKAKAISDATQANKVALQDNAAANAAKNKAGDTTELNAVAFDPNYQNPDGSMGANVVMSKADAAAKGLAHYKADPAKLNATVAGFNDVQNKINMLAQVANDPKRMGAVQPDVAAALMEAGDGVQLGAFGTRIDTTKINANLYATNMEKANQATRDYVTALLGAHEAITQLPRLQTFGQSSRMTQQQMEAAQKLLPQPGDAPIARQKMTALQQMLDPLRKQVPHMPGAEQIPSWLEKQGGQ